MNKENCLGRPKLILPEKCIINSYLLGDNTYQLGKLYNISHGTIRNILIRNDIKLRKRTEIGRAKSKFSLNENIFDLIDSHEKAYWLGFLITDGGIFNGAISLHIAIKDINHLEKFKSFMGSNHNIYIRKNKHPSCRLRFKSQKLCSKLSKYGIVPNKTFIAKFGKNIPKKYLCSYILGIIDGDGSFTNSNNNMSISITSASKKFINDLQNTLVTKCNLNKTKINHIKNKYILTYCGNNQVPRIAKYVYSKSSIFLERKKNKIIF